MDELDLTNSKWVPENEIYLMSMIEGIKEMYPDADFDAELEEMGYTYDDIINNQGIILGLMKNLNDKYSV